VSPTEGSEKKSAQCEAVAELERVVEKASHYLSAQAPLDSEHRATHASSSGAAYVAA